MKLGERKREIQEEIFSQTKGTILGLAGPRPHEYLNIVGEDVILYENDPKIYRSLHNSMNVPYYFGDIQYAKPTRIIDLDLMRTGQVERDRILHMFKKQIEAFTKAMFVYTICSRNNHNDLVYEISKIIESFNGSGDITKYKYKEGAPMQTIQVCYSRTKR